MRVVAKSGFSRACAAKHAHAILENDLFSTCRKLICFGNRVLLTPKEMGHLLQTCSCLISSLNALNRSFVPDSFRSFHVANLGPKNSLHAGLLQSCCAFPTGFKGFSHPFHFSLVALMGLGLVLVCWASQGPSAPLSVQVCIHLVPCVGPDCFLAFFVCPILVSPGMNLT